MSTLGRNDPCPCGSGKKYKKCCLNTGAFVPTFTKEDVTTAWSIALTVFEEEALEPEYDAAGDDFYSLISEELVETVESNEDTAEISHEMLDNWFLFDRKTKKGDRPIDRILAGELPSDRIRQALVALAGAKQRVYRVAAVVPKQSVTLVDVHSTVEVVLPDPLLANDCREGEVVSCRIMPGAPQRPPYVFTVVIGFSDEQRDELLIDIADVTKDIVDEGGKPEDAESDYAPLIHSHWALDAEPFDDDEHGECEGCEDCDGEGCEDEDCEGCEDCEGDDDGGELVVDGDSDTAGVDTAGVDTAGVDTAGVDTAGVDTAGVDATDEPSEGLSEGGAVPEGGRAPGRAWSERRAPRPGRGD